MRIVNAMFGTGSGGIEQAFIDYTEALQLAGHQVLALAHPDADVVAQLSGMDTQYATEKNRGKWDLFAVKKLRTHLHQYQPDIIVAHGNRAISLLRQCRYPAVLLGVCHNYKFKQLLTCDVLISVSEDIRQQIILAGYAQDRIMVVPNMIRLPEQGSVNDRNDNGHIPVVAVAGRFVAKKGIDVFIRAIRILADRKLSFRAVIAGAGADDDLLRQLAHELELDEVVRFTGWINDKADFYKGVDIFCVPSLHEPFGIVVLEAFVHALPVVSSDSEGPSEIIRHNENGLLVPRGESKALADAMERLLTHKDLVRSLGKAGLDTVQTHYAMPVVAGKLDAALQALNMKAGS